MRRIWIILLVGALGTCKDEVNTSYMIREVTASQEQFQADGQTIVFLNAILNNDLDIRNVLFKVDNGSFADNKDADSIVVSAEKIKDQLTAVTKYTAPLTPGTITIRVQLQIPDYKGQFVVERQLLAVESVPSRLVLSANAFSVYNNFDGEIQITGKLTNSNGNNVSKGHKIVLLDVNKDGQPFGGHFRNESLSSDKSSLTSAAYTPGLVQAGQTVYLIGTVLDDLGKRTSISDTIAIAVTEKH